MMKSKPDFDSLQDSKATRRDVKRTKKAQPSDNRRAVKLIAALGKQVKLPKAR